MHQENGPATHGLGVPSVWIGLQGRSVPTPLDSASLCNAFSSPPLRLALLGLKKHSCMATNSGVHNCAFGTAGRLCSSQFPARVSSRGLLWQHVTRKSVASWECCIRRSVRSNCRKTTLEPAAVPTRGTPKIALAATPARGAIRPLQNTMPSGKLT